MTSKIEKRIKEKLNAIQKKIFLLEKQQYSIPELLDKLISFSLQHENEFLEYISTKKYEKESNLQNENFFKFIMSPVEGAGPEDYKEFDFDED